MKNRYGHQIAKSNIVKISPDDDEFYSKNPDWKPHKNKDGEQMGWKSLDGNSYAYYEDHYNRVKANQKALDDIATGCGMNVLIILLLCSATVGILINTIS